MSVPMSVQTVPQLYLCLYLCLYRQDPSCTYVCTYVCTDSTPAVPQLYLCLYRQYPSCTNVCYLCLYRMYLDSIYISVLTVFWFYLFLYTDCTSVLQLYHRLLTVKKTHKINKLVTLSLSLSYTHINLIKSVLTCMFERVSSEQDRAIYTGQLCVSNLYLSLYANCTCVCTPTVPGWCLAVTWVVSGIYYG